MHTQNRFRVRLQLESLEDRLAPAVYRVLTLADTVSPADTAHAGTAADPFLAPNLRSAINSANDEVNHPGADTIVFDPSISGGFAGLTVIGDGTFGPSALRVSSTITIAGTGETIFRRGNTPFRLFYVTGTGNLTLDRVTLKDGYAHGGNGMAGGGGAAGMGGAILNEGVLAVTNSTLTRNEASGGNGGGVSGGNGGGGGGLSGDGGFSGGGSDGYGGGLGGGDDGGAGGDDGSFGPSSNGGDGGDGGLGSGGGGGGGGGIALENGANAFGGQGGAGGFGGGGGAGGDSGSSKSGPSGGGFGGFGGFGGGGGGGGGGNGKADSGGRGGFGGFGGGDGGDGDNSDGNGGDGDSGGGGGGAGMGGAIFNLGGTVYLANATLSRNYVGGGGGGSATSHRDNGAGLGGALFNYNGIVTILNSTLADNVVADAPEAAEAANGGSVYNLAIAPQQVGGAASAGLFLFNSILAASTMPAGARELVNNQIAGVAQVNFGIRATKMNVVTSFANVGGGGIYSDFIVTDPDLGPLQDNGGLTFTHAIAAGSSAANAGDNHAQGLTGVLTDQRDSPRISGDAVDIGAFEIFVPPPPQQPPPVIVVNQIANVTAQVAVRSLGERFDARTGTTTLLLRLHNRGPTTLTGPISFVLLGLPMSITLLSRTGLTALTGPKKTPFQNVRLGPANLVQVTSTGASVTSLGGARNEFLPGDSRTLKLVFKNPLNASFRFRWHILAGAGAR